MKQDLISPEGFRLDGRRPIDLRNIKSQIRINNAFDGSAKFNIGNTQIIAKVFGPREPRLKSQINHDRTFISVEIFQASFSSTQGGGSGGGSGDYHGKGKQESRLKELEEIIKTSFESVIMMESFPKTIIEITLEVWSSDGSILASCINATTLALIDAGIPIKDYLISCTCMAFQSLQQPSVYFLDVNRQEEMQGGMGFMTMAMLPQSNTIITLIHEPLKIPIDQVKYVMEECEKGIQIIFNTLDQQVTRPTISLQLENLKQDQHGEQEEY